MQNRIICITGQDRSGKATQSKLLQAALGPDTTLMSFPEYDRPLGMLLKALLRGEDVRVQRRLGFTETFPGEGYWNIDEARAVQSRTPMYVQLLNTLARIEAQERIGKALEKGHVVMDRYDMDTFIYGAAEGVPLKHLAALHEMLTYKSDFTIYLYGAQFDRGGEKDANEKDQRLQNAVAQNCIALASLYPGTSCAMDLDLHVSGWVGTSGKIAAIEDVHWAICDVLNSRRVFGTPVRPLCQEKIEHLVEISDHEKQEALA